MVGLWLGLVAMIVVYLVFPDVRRERGSWGGIPGWTRLAAMVAAVVAGFVIGAVLASYVGWLRRLFTPRRQMTDEVAGRARQMFFDHRVHHTAGGTGLCVYVSLHERMALVVADQAVAEKLAQQGLDELSAQLVGDLRGGDVTDAICSAVRGAGERLGPLLPRTAADADELPDALVTID